MTDQTTVPASVEIRSATSADAPVVANVISHAFQHLAVARWLIPQESDRQPVLEANMRIFTDHALVDGHGMADITSDNSAVAVWFPHGAEPPPEPTGYGARLDQACGMYADNFRHLDDKFAQHHPHGTPHHHLAFMAVLPSRQGTGLGTALLRRHFALHPGTACYLEASCPQSYKLYARHGWKPYSDPFHLPDGTPMWPMWRDVSP